MEAAVANKTSVRAQAKLVKEYEDVCKAEGIRAFPPEYIAISLYVSELVRRRSGGR